jgi:hypothetical protein
MSSLKFWSVSAGCTPIGPPALQLFTRPVGGPGVLELSADFFSTEPDAREPFVYFCTMLVVVAKQLIHGPEREEGEGVQEVIGPPCRLVDTEEDIVQKARPRDPNRAVLPLLKRDGSWSKLKGGRSPVHGVSVPPS